MDGSFINMQEKTEFGSFGPQVEFDAPEVEVAPTTGNISNVPEPDTFSYKRGKTVEQRGKDLGEWTKKTIESTTGNMDDSEYTPFVSEAMYLAAQALDKLGIPEQIERVGRFQQRSADPYDSNMYGIDETGLIPIIHRQLKPEAKEALTDLAGWLDPGMAGGAGIVKGWRSQLQNFLETQTKPRSAKEWKQFLGGAVKKPDTFGAEELQMSGISDFLEKANPKEKITPEELVYVYQTNEIPMEVSKVINDPELRRYKEEFDQVKDLQQDTIDYGRVVEQPQSDLGTGATKSSGDLTKKWQDLFLGTDPSRVPIFRAGVRWKGEVNLAPLQRGAGGDYLSSHPYAKGYGEEGAVPGYMCPDEVFRTRKQMIPYIEREFGIIIHDPDADMWDDGLQRFTAEGVEDVLRKGKVKDEIKEVGIKIKDADTGKEYAEGGVVDTADLREKLDISEQPFDPMGTGYDYSTALREGLGMDETGHWPSRAPQSGQLLKGRQHPTYNLTEQGEAEAGYAIQTRADNRGYSAPAFERLTQGVYQDDAGNIFQVTKEGDIIPLGGEKFTRTNNSGIMSK